MMKYDLADKLRALIKVTGQDEVGFVRDFSQTSMVDRRTPFAWLSGKKAHTPARENLEKIASYFRNKLSLDEFPVELFYRDTEDFSRALNKLVAKQKSNSAPPIELPFDPQALTEATKAYLIGTYHLYRYSFVGDRGQIVREVCAIRNSNDPRTLDVELRTPSIRDAFNAQTKPENLETFVGKLWRFGRMFSAILTHTDENIRDRRMRVFSFPILAAQRTTHYGLVMSYSVHLEQPVAARMIASKVSDKDSLLEEGRSGAVCSMSDDDPRIKGIARYLCNALANNEQVLTADYRSLPWDLPLPPSGKALTSANEK